MSIIAGGAKEVIKLWVKRLVVELYSKAARYMKAVGGKGIAINVAA